MAENGERYNNNTPTGAQGNFQMLKTILLTIGAMAAILYGSDVYIKAKVESYAASKDWVSQRIGELAPTLRSSTITESDIGQIKKDILEIKELLKERADK